MSKCEIRVRLLSDDELSELREDMKKASDWMIEKIRSRNATQTPKLKELLNSVSLDPLVKD